MKSSMIRILTGSLLAAVTFLTIGLRETAHAEALKFNDYTFSQYIVSDGKSPHSIVRLDNNWDLLVACQQPKTEDELTAGGLSFANSQLALLQSFRLLEEDDQGWRTTFPILDSNSATAIRQLCREASKGIADELNPTIKDLLNTTGKSGRSKSAFTILFSYVMDDLVWRIWEADSTLEAKEIELDKPFWAGEVWAIYPPREFACGTNTLSEEGVSLKVNWSKSIIKKMLPFITDWSTLEKLLDDYRDQNQVVTKAAFETFKPFNLFDDDGNFTIPVITAKKGDLLHDQCQSIAVNLARLTKENLDLVSMTKSCGFRDERQALVVVYHELMWELLDELCQRGTIQRPVAFADPVKATAKDIGDLVFIVRN